MLYSTKLFLNTGFNPQNIPDTKTLLEQSQTIALEGLWLLQDRVQNKLRINASYESVKNADYCVVGTTYYFIINIKMLNNNTCELELVPDYLTTMGLENMQIISGWATRRHVTDDTLFSNLIEEPFQPTDNIVMDIGRGLGETSGESLDVLSATVDLLNFNFEADTYTNPINSYYVTVPKVPAQTRKTRISLETSSAIYTFYIPSTSLYEYTETIADKVQSLRSLGIENCITSSYRIPKYFLGDLFKDGDLITSIKNTFIRGLTTGLKFKYQDNIKNNKVFTGQFQTYKLSSVTSGKTVEYKPEDIKGQNGTEPTFVIFADLQPNGKPYCRAEYFMEDKENVFINVCEGSPWLNYQLTFYSQEAQALKDINYTRKMATGVIDTVSAGVTGAVSGYASTGNPYGAVAGAIAGAGKGVLNMAGERVDYNLAKNVFVPEINFPVSFNLQNYINNLFWCYRTRLSERDTINFDNFLTQFGYAVFEPLTKECFTGRQYFNYIKCENLNLNWDNYPQSFIMGGIAQLQNGVRIWHTKPTTAAMYNNPII